MSRAAVGLVLARPARLLGEESFFMELIAGMDEALEQHNRSVLLQVVPDRAAEIAAWRRWSADRLVEALVVVDLVDDDPRHAVLPHLDLPAVVLGGPHAGFAVSSVYVNDEAAARTVVAALDDLGHRSIGRVSGPRGLWHTQHRDAACRQECARRGLRLRILEGDYSERTGAALTRELLTGEDAPTAIVFDNDAMAIGGLAAAQASGRRVPQDVSLIGWDDSNLCRLADPALSVIAVDVHAIGVQLAGVVLDAVAGAPVRVHPAVPHRLVLRDSTAVALQAAAN